MYPNLKKIFGKKNLHSFLDNVQIKADFIVLPAYTSSVNYNTRDSQNCHKAIPLTSSPYQRSSKVITGHQSYSKAINMSHKSESHQSDSQKSDSHQNESHQNESS